MNVRYCICLAFLLACGRADPPASSPEPPMEEPELLNLSVDASLPLVAVDAAMPQPPRTYTQIPKPELPPEVDVKYGDFLGAKACANCHSEQYDKWKVSSHGLAGGPPSTDTIVAPFDGKPLRFSDAEVRPINRGGKFFFEVREGNRGVERVDIVGVVGRGHMKGGGTQVYLADDGAGRLLMLPFDYSVTDEKWFCQAKRGKGWEYITEDLRLRDCEWPPWRGLGVTGGPNCQNCHASQVEVLWDGVEGQYETRYKSLSIDCESCHGPGREHREFHANQGAQQTEDPMPSLIGLTPDESLDVCMRCHSTKSVTEAGYLPGRGYGNHFTQVHLVDDGLNALDARGRIREFAYQEGHLLSACYAKGAMVCTDCHTPHGLTYRDVNGRALSDWSDDGQCTGCHTGVVGDKHLHGGHAKGARCVDCHMPYVQHPGVKHQVSYARSDHRIVSPVAWEGTAAIAGDACLKCHQWSSTTERADALRRAFGSVRPQDPRLLTLDRLEGVELFGADAITTVQLEESIALLQQSFDWPPLRLVRVLSVLSRVSLSTNVRQFTEAELKLISDVGMAKSVALRAASAALLLLVSDVQPEAGAHFEVLAENTSIQHRLQFYRQTSFNLFALLMSYGFDDPQVTDRLVGVVKRFTKQLGTDGPRQGLFVGRALASVGRWSEAFESYRAALEHPRLKMREVLLEKGGAPTSIFDEMAARFARQQPRMLLETVESLPPYLKKQVNVSLTRCRLHMALRQIAQSDACYEELLATKPKLGQAHFERAQVQLEAREQAKAIRSLELGLKIHPEDEQAKKMLEFLKMRNWEEAR